MLHVGAACALGHAIVVHVFALLFFCGISRIGSRGYDGVVDSGAL